MEHDEGLIGCFVKNDREEVRVALTRYLGHDLLDIRIWSKSYRTGEYAPTKKGISIKVEQTVNLLTLVEKAFDVAKEKKLLSAA